MIGFRANMLGLCTIEIYTFPGSLRCCSGSCDQQWFWSLAVAWLQCGHKAAALKNDSSCVVPRELHRSKCKEQGNLEQLLRHQTVAPTSNDVLLLCQMP